MSSFINPSGFYRANEAGTWYEPSAIARVLVLVRTDQPDPYFVIEMNPFGTLSTLDQGDAHKGPSIVKVWMLSSAHSDGFDLVIVFHNKRYPLRGDMKWLNIN